MLLKWLKAEWRVSRDVVTKHPFVVHLLYSLTMSSLHFWYSMFWYKIMIECNTSIKCRRCLWFYHSCARSNCASALTGILNTRFTVRDHARRRSRAVRWLGGYCSKCTFFSSTCRFLRFTRYFFSCGRTEISFLAYTNINSLAFSLLYHVITGCWNKHDGLGREKGYVRFFKLDFRETCISFSQLLRNEKLVT